MEAGSGFWMRVGVRFRYGVESQGQVSRSDFGMGVGIRFHDKGLGWISGLGSGFGMGVEV